MSDPKKYLNLVKQLTLDPRLNVDTLFDNSNSGDAIASLRVQILLTSIYLGNKTSLEMADLLLNKDSVRGNWQIRYNENGHFGQEHTHNILEYFFKKIDSFYSNSYTKPEHTPESVVAHFFKNKNFITNFNDANIKYAFEEAIKLSQKNLKEPGKAPLLSGELVNAIINTPHINNRFRLELEAIADSYNFKID